MDDLNKQELQPLKEYVLTRPDVFFGGFGASIEDLLQARLFHEKVLRALYAQLAIEQDPRIRQSLDVALAVARENYSEAQRLEERILTLTYVWITKLILRRSRVHTLAAAVVVVIGVVVFLISTR
jgi:hypothetical protein